MLKKMFNTVLSYHFKCLCILLFCMPVVYAQQSEMVSLQWKPLRTIKGDSTIAVFSFENSNPSQKISYLPVWKKEYSTPFDKTVEFTLTKAEYVPVNEKENYFLFPYVSFIQNADVFTQTEVHRMKGDIVNVTVFPFRYNIQNHTIEKLLSFTLTSVESEKTIKKSTTASTTVSYPDSSVLSNGKWCKLSVQQRGIYQITYQDMSKMGFDMANVKTSDIAVFGNGNGWLPDQNSDVKYTDLQENAIMVVDGNKDGIFGSGDYILFYSPDVVVWSYNSTSKLFEHQQNIYDDFNYYFITTQAGIGNKKRIQTGAEVTTAANKQITTFNDYKVHEQELENVVKTGRIWFGENFKTSSPKKVTSFLFPNIVPDSANVKVKIAVASVSPGGASSFSVLVNSTQKEYTLGKTSSSSAEGDQATDAIDVFSIPTPSNGMIDVNMTYSPFDFSSKGYVDYITVNALRNLKMNGNQMNFRSTESVGAGNISEFTITGVSPACKVWDVTDIFNVQEIPALFNNNTLVFKAKTDSLREYIIFSSSQWFSPSQTVAVENQNLHQLRNIDYVIYSHSSFKTQAEQLAKLHHDIQGLNVAVVYPSQVYNEFSGGKQDPLAIRWLMKMLYDQTTDTAFRPKYLLLFGDASYDYKKIQGNTNFIPTYESNAHSYDPSVSYATDDQFGFLEDDADGMTSSDQMLIGIGRFPVATPAEAEAMVKKVEIYSAKTNLTNSVSNPSIISNLGSWRKNVTMVADDQDAYGDDNFTFNTEDLANKIQALQPDIYVEKLYADAFEQQSTAVGQAYPEVNRLLNRQIEKGTFLVNYNGHGSPKNWMDERVLGIADIQQWRNTYNMPIFITATCSFSRYDDPELISAGEQVLLNARGGGIALFSTSRTTYQSENIQVNQHIIKNIFTKTFAGSTLGEAMQNTKNELSKNNSSIKSFILLGDPAIPVLSNDYNVVTTHINQQPVSAANDTIKAMMKVKIDGNITNNENAVVQDFSGILSISIFDKATMTNTLGNDGAHIEIPYVLQNRILYKGNVVVKNGQFTAEFVVPNDIVYQYGKGKIYYYAYGDSTTASGCYENLVVGSFDSTATIDLTSPSVKLYMNTTDFKNGGITDNNPILLAFVADTNGINASGSLGHDLTAVLDGQYNVPYILNDYYLADLGTYTSGTIRYPMRNLSPGIHTIEVKVWDVFANSAKSSITFEVKDQSENVVQNLYNYPNPFTDKTYFVFEENQPDKIDDIQIQIYSVFGQEVRNLHYPAGEIIGYQTPPLEWDGTNANGVRIAGGVYVYVATIKFADGSTVRKSSKLILQNFK